MREELARRELAHRACADQHRGLVLEAVEDAARQLDGRRADGDGFLRDPGLAPHALGDRERLVKAAMEHATRRTDRRRHPVLLLQLPEDLRLTDDHGIEAGGDAEEVANRLAIGVRVEVRRQGGVRDAVLAGEERRQRAPDSGLVQVPRNFERAAQFAVDLHGDRHLLVARQLRIGNGPGLLGEQALAAQRYPHLFGEMRHHRTDQPGHGFQTFAEHLSGSPF